MSTHRPYGLDVSSPAFLEQLDILRHDKEWIDQLKTLPEGDFVELIGYLNNV